MSVKTAIETRRAYRSLLPAEINYELLYELARAAQLAPSCFNKQPWRYVFIYQPEKLKSFHKALPENNDWAKEASLIIAVISEDSLDCKLKDGRDYFLFDTGISSGFLMLRAAELDLVAHPMAGYDQNMAKKILNIPSEMTLINLIAVGKHNENYKLSLNEEKIVIEENRPPRKDLEEFIFIDSYGSPFKRR